MPLEQTKDQDDPHYKKHVTELGDTEKIVTNQDVYSTSGIKLLAAGTHLNSSLSENILRHKLLPPLDRVLSIENSVSVSDLVGHAREVMADHAVFARMQLALDHGQDMLKIIGGISLNTPLAFKLTVAQKRLPELYDHGVAAALCCAFLGFKSGLKTPKVIRLATAGLFHDLGELHIDPELLARRNSLNDTEIRHFFTHPITAHSIILEYPEFDPALATAVLEHHERMDGSGYPRGTKEISQLGRLLAVAEVFAGLYHTWGEAGGWRIRAALKLNIGHQLDFTGVSSMLDALTPEDSTATATCVDIKMLCASLRQMAEHFNCWGAAYRSAPETIRSSKPVVFIATQMNLLQQALESTGFNYENICPFIETLDGNSQEAQELRAVVEEFAWRIPNVVIRELHRRWPELGDLTSDPVGEFVRDWMKQVKEVVFLLDAGSA